MARKRVTIEKDFFGNGRRYHVGRFVRWSRDDEIIVVARPVRGRRVRIAHIEGDEDATAIAAGGILGLGLGILVGALVGGKKKAQ